MEHKDLKFLDGAILKNEMAGRVGDKILRYENNNGEDIYYKCGYKESAASLQSEMIRLKWLAGRGIHVPEILYYSQSEYETILVISGIPGKCAFEVFPIEKALEISAHALKEIHSLTVNAPTPFDNILRIELNELKDLVSEDKINIEQFEADNEGKSPEEVLQFLISHADMFRNNTFTHGDYCLPNILIDGNKYGIIDWGQAGMGDQYRDFAAVEGSIKRNFGEEYIDEFYLYYGLNPQDIDKSKIDYYKKIDQFHYNQIIDC